MSDLTWTVGQKVFEPGTSWSGYPGRPLIVERVTAGGRAVIGSNQYDADGRKRGERYGSRIVPFADEHQAALDLWGRQREADKLAEGIKWRTLDADQLDIALPALRALTKTEQPHV